MTTEEMGNDHDDEADDSIRDARCDFLRAILAKIETEIRGQGADSEVWQPDALMTVNKLQRKFEG